MKKEPHQGIALWNFKISGIKRTVAKVSHGGGGAGWAVGGKSPKGLGIKKKKKTPVFLTATFLARRQWSSVFKFLKENYF